MINDKNSKIDRPNKFKFSLLVFVCSIILPACQLHAESDSENIFAVQWFSGLKMVDNLDKPINVTIQTDLKKMLTLPWYDKFTVAPTKDGKTPISLSNCSEYLSKRTDETRPVTESELNSYVELGIMCQATELIANAGKSSETYIDITNLLTESAPNKLPWELSFVISASRYDELKKQSKAKSWADVDRIIKIEKQSNYSAVYVHEDKSTQRLDLVGIGDLNNDRILDVLLTSTDNVNEGSYFNIRLFALTRKSKNGSYQLIKEYGF